MSPADPGRASGERPVDVVNYSGSLLPGTNKKRPIPAPWIDCEQCTWRHYPTITRRGWHIATGCANCGAALGSP